MYGEKKTSALFSCIFRMKCRAGKPENNKMITHDYTSAQCNFEQLAENSMESYKQCSTDTSRIINRNIDSDGFLLQEQRKLQLRYLLFFSD